MQLNEDQALDHQESTPLTAVTGSEEESDNVLASSHGISQYQPIQQEYVLQQVSQSEEVYDDRLVHLESQPAVSQEPVYTLETHEEPSLIKGANVAQGNFTESGSDRGKENEAAISLKSGSNTGTNVVSGGLSFENELSASFSQSSSTADAKVFQHIIDSNDIQAYNQVDSCDIEGHVPFGLNNSSPVKSYARQEEILQPARLPVQSQLITSSGTSPRGQQTWMRIVNKDGVQAVQTETSVTSKTQANSSKKLSIKGKSESYRSRLGSFFFSFFFFQ